MARPIRIMALIGCLRKMLAAVIVIRSVSEEISEILAHGSGCERNVTFKARITVVCMLAFAPIAIVNFKATAEEAPAVQLSEGQQQKCLKILRAGIRSDEFWPSIHAAEALTLAGHGHEVRRLLEPKLITERDDQQRCGLARELVRAGDWQKAAIMLEILAGEEPHGHVHAAESLYKVGEIGDGRAMRRAMEQTQNTKLQLMAAAALARCGNPMAMKLLREKLAVDDADTNRIAAWILARIGDRSDLPQLRKNAGSAKDELTRCYQENALAALGDKSALSAMKRNLSSSDPAVRTYAATFAGDARALEVADDLVPLLDDDNIDVRVRAAQSLLVLSQTNVERPPQFPQPARWHPAPRAEISRLVYPDTKEHPRYTEGSILRLADDSLLYAVTQFVGGGSDFSRAQIVARQSRDGGHTWGEPRVLQESTGKMNVMSVTLRRLNDVETERQPSGAKKDAVVHQPIPSTIAMFYLQKNSYDDLRVYVRFSTDEAKSFGDPVLVTKEPGYHVMNNDRVTQLSSGRILAPVASTRNVRKVNHFVSYCWLSDDNGRTWRKGKGHVDQAKRGAMEPEVVELRDGQVMMIVRTQLGYIAVSYSSDGGDSWTDPEQLSNLKAPEAPATLRRIPATGDLVLIWNNTHQQGAGHGGRRTPLTAAISTDEGKTWKHIRNLETRNDRTYAYTSLTFVKDHAVMSYWERSPTGLSSRFRSIPVAWFYAEARVGEKTR